tara:strand:+ start:867 stop:1217 length:351 start_codon:yes stop_codon:yes gene_type:complete
VLLSGVSQKSLNGITTKSKEEIIFNTPNQGEKSMTFANRLTTQDKDTITQEQLALLRDNLNLEDCEHMYLLSGALQNLGAEGFFDNYSEEYQEYVESVFDWLGEFPRFIATEYEVF